MIMTHVNIVKFSDSMFFFFLLFFFFSFFINLRPPLRSISTKFHICARYFMKVSFLSIFHFLMSSFSFPRVLGFYFHFLFFSVFLSFVAFYYLYPLSMFSISFLIDGSSWICCFLFLYFPF